ncbi:YlbF family regulator [Bacillus sp. FJAT-45350]|uniref:YlbF family regulator n=1 Tax=Bacillus sp. FJAT-45350 TaxID=2011014 RepID=UPI000BB776EB|nr:YlbF family regulator [Bacillus sp. FJAT-45350]
MSLTATSTDVLSETDMLSQMVIQSELFYNYQAKKRELQQDEEAQSLIRQFQYIKDQYEDAQRFGKYHPDYLKIVTETRELKREVDLQPSVAAFKKAEKELEDILIEISTLIAHSVSKTIKVPTGNPYFDSMSCSGGCSTGGSCGCG